MKNIFKSKTFWFNALHVAGAVSGVAAFGLRPRFFGATSGAAGAGGTMGASTRGGGGAGGAWSSTTGTRDGTPPTPGMRAASHAGYGTPSMRCSSSSSTTSPDTPWRCLVGPCPIAADADAGRKT